MPLVMVSNEVNVYHKEWKDIVGVQYHYPNTYVNKVQPGERFIYYRGVRRADGTRGKAEYFGSGVIGEVWRDPEVDAEVPKKDRYWYCSICDYTPFPHPLAAKGLTGQFENIQQNLWSVGIRSIDEDTYERIIAAAGLANLSEPPLEQQFQLPGMSMVIPIEDNQLIATVKKSGGPVNDTSRILSITRYSRHSKLIGDRAEEVAFKWLEQNLKEVKELRWVAREGLTPGWDIQYKDLSGTLHAVEVKGSTGAAFTTFELTANELSAANAMGNTYWLMLVADCFSSNPRVQRIQGLSHLIELGELSTEPIRWRVWKKL